MVTGLVAPSGHAGLNDSNELDESMDGEIAEGVVGAMKPDEPVDLPEATVTVEDQFAWRAEGNRRGPRVARELGLSPDELLEAHSARVRPEGPGTSAQDATVVLRYDRTYAGLPVVRGSFIVHMTRSGEIRWTSPHITPIRVPTTSPTMSSDSAVRAALASTEMKRPQLHRAPDLIIFVLNPDDSPVLAWRTRLINRGRSGGEEVFTDAHTGAILERISTGLTFEKDNDAMSSGS